MTEGEVKALLMSGQSAKGVWNLKRAKGESMPREIELKISGLNNTDCDLSGFDLSGLKFRGLDLTSVDLVSANLSNVVFIASSIKHSNLSGADLRGAYMAGLELGPTVSLEGANLTGSTGLAVDGEFITNAIMPVGDAERWHSLVRVYTKSRMVFNLLFASFALAQPIIRVFSMIAYEEYLAATGQTGLQPMKTEQIWAILLGLDRSFIFAVTACILFAYNGARLVLTWWVTRLHDEQLRTGFAPRRFRYSLIAWIHATFLRWIFWLAIVSGAVQIVPWLLSDIPVP